MKRIILGCTIAIIATFSSTAQTKIKQVIIEKKDGTKTRYAVSDLKRIYFEDLEQTSPPPAFDIEYATIAGGTFTMGSPLSEGSRGSDETPHSITLSGFKMSKHEITNAQFCSFLNTNNIGSDGKWTNGLYPELQLIIGNNKIGCAWDKTALKWKPATNHDNHPVINVTWYGATEFARWVGGRLPTEAEWEYACRANTNGPFGINTGTKLDASLAQFNWQYTYDPSTTPGGHTDNGTTTSKPTETAPVGSFTPNAWGLFDMHGNAIEWCNDWHGPYLTTPQTNPFGAENGTRRVMRGGSWKGAARYCRSANRGSGAPELSSDDYGFRVVIPITM